MEKADIEDNLDPLREDIRKQVPDDEGEQIETYLKEINEQVQGRDERDEKDTDNGYGEIEVMREKKTLAPVSGQNVDGEDANRNRDMNCDISRSGSVSVSNSSDCNRVNENEYIDSNANSTTDLAFPCAILNQRNMSSTLVEPTAETSNVVDDSGHGSDNVLQCNGHLRASANENTVSSNDIENIWSSEKNVNDSSQSSEHCLAEGTCFITERKQQEYRCVKSLVVYSDSETESDAEDSSSETEGQSSGDQSSFEDEFDFDDGDTDEGEDINAKRERPGQADKSDGRLRTRDEVFPEELPPLDYLSISAGEDIKLEPLGTVTGIVDVLVVIQSVDASPALFDDTVLFLENRKPLGLIFETMGTVERPFYSVRFNSNADIENRGVNVGDKVMYAPEASNLTKFVFIAELQRRKFVDASWESDNEPPLEEWDYSDDEQETRARRKLFMAKRRQQILEAKKERRKSNKKKRRSSKAQKKEDTAGGGDSTMDVSSTRKSGLPRGPLNRNPFGDPSDIAGRLAKSKKSAEKARIIRSTNTSFNSGSSMSSTAWKPPPPPVMFGGKPNWKEQNNINSNSINDNNSSSISSGQFSLASPNFQSGLPPVYNLTNPTTSNFGFAFATGSGLAHPSNPQTTSMPQQSTTSKTLIMPPSFNANQPPPQSPTPPTFNAIQSILQSPSSSNPLVMPPILNTSQPAPKPTATFNPFNIPPPPFNPSHPASQFNMATNPFVKSPFNNNQSPSQTPITPRFNNSQLTSQPPSTPSPFTTSPVFHANQSSTQPSTTPSPFGAAPMFNAPTVSVPFATPPLFKASQLIPQSHTTPSPFATPSPVNTSQPSTLQPPSTPNLFAQPSAFNPCQPLNTFATPPTFNTNQSPSFVPSMFTPQFSQSQTLPPTNVTPPASKISMPHPPPPPHVSSQK